MENKKKQRKYWLGRRPGQQGPRPTSGLQDVVEKLVTGSTPEDEIPGSNGASDVTGNSIQLRKQIRMGTWNVRSLIETGKLKLLSMELERNQVKLCGLSEIWWKGKGHFQTEDGHTVVYSGHDDTSRQGVALWMAKDIAGSLVSYDPVSPRILVVKLKAAPRDITVIQVYAPTAAAEEDEHEKFYDQLEAALSKTSK